MIYNKMCIQNKMKKTLFIIIFLIFAKSEGYTQTDNTVVITTIGSGSTYENAKVNALRSALEQVSGVYLSANTLIINDKLISDNISTISSGSIKNFEILEQLFSKNQFIVTVKSVISLNKFAEFVTNKTGSSVEIKGGLFAANIKLLDLNEKAELNAIKNLCNIYNDLLFSSIYYELKVNTPIQNTKKLIFSENLYVVPLDIEMRFTMQVDSANNFLKHNLQLICLNNDELISYEAIPRKVYSITIDEKEYWFRNAESPNKLLKIDKNETNTDYQFAFYLDDGINKFNRYTGEGSRPQNIQSVSFIRNLKDFKNISDAPWCKVITFGFNSELCNYPCGNEYMGSFYTCQYNFYRYKKNLLLPDKDTKLPFHLDGYYKLGDLEKIKEIKIVKKSNPKIKE